MSLLDGHYFLSYRCYLISTVHNYIVNLYPTFAIIMLIASQKLVSAPYIIGSQTLNTSGLFYHRYTFSCPIATIYLGMFTILSVTLPGPNWYSHLHE